MAAILKKWPPYLLCSLLQELSTKKLFRMVPQTRWYPTTFYSIPCQVDQKMWCWLPGYYCSAVWSNRYQSQTTQLRKVQKRAARLILNQSYETPSAELFTNLKWMTLDERFEFNRVVMIYKCLHNCAPSYLQSDLINPSDFHDHFTRHTISGKLSLPKFKTDCYKYSPIVSSISAWNRLDSEIREASSIYSFKKLFKQSI